MAGRGDETVELRKRRWFPRPQIGEQNAALLHHRIRLVPDVGTHAASLGFGRCLQALPRHVEQPAVEGAAQAAVLEAAEGEVGAPVRTGARDPAVAALIVAEDDEIFAEQADRL